METIKVLFNNCCGGFIFSKQFRDEYTVRTGKDVKENYYDMQRLRYDPVAITLYEERGSEWCSDPNSSMIDMTEVPKVFAAYIDIENDMGDETVRVQVSEALADILEEFMKSGNREELDAKYASICAGREWMHKRTFVGSSHIPVPVAGGGGGLSRVVGTLSNAMSNAALYGGGGDYLERDDGYLGSDELTDLTDVPILKISDAFVSDDSDTDN